MHRVAFFLISAIALLNTGAALRAQEPPSMPMQAHNEDGANYRWLAKKVLDSRLLDGMEDLSNWIFRGQGEMTLSDARTHQGAHSLQVRSVVPAPDPTPGARRPDQGHMSASRAFPGEDWSAFNRISVWIYPDIVGTRFISFAVTMHNDGKQKVPDRQNEGRDESVLLNNHAWNHVVWEIEPIARDKVTAIDLQYTQPKMLPDPGDSTVFYFDQLELERVVADHTEGWNVAPGKIAFSHSGYTPGSPKSAIASDLAAAEFQLVRQETGDVVLSKPVRRAQTELGAYQTLDFSEIREPGTYVIRAGDTVTRPFRIADDAWRSSIWKAINFFYSERCGMEIPGVHGICHRDCYTVHGDKRIVVNGGWHDAGDLSPTNHTPEITYGLLTFAESLQLQGQDPALTRRLIDEAKWGLDWLIKTRFGDGYRIGGLLIGYWSNGIMGDSDDKVGQAQNDPEVNFRDTAVEALAYRVLKQTDPELAARSLRVAKEDWDFAVKDLAAAPPFEPIYGAKDELERASFAVQASIELYKATGEKRYADKAFEMGQVVLASQQRKLHDWKLPLTGFFYASPAKEILFQRFHVGQEQVPIVALARLCETFPGHKDWMQWYSAAVLHSEYYLKNAAKITEPYGVVGGAIYRESDVKLIPEKPGWRQLAQASREVYTEQVRRGYPLGPDYFLRRFPVWFDFRGNFSVLLSQAKALSTAGHLRGDLDAVDLAEKQAQWVVGRNPFVSSGMYGEGYDWTPLYSERSGHIVGALPVGIETLANNDAPYWPTQINWTYKEVWVHSTSRWLYLMQDISRPASVEGLVKPAADEPVEFREETTGQITTVAADLTRGEFRATLPEGRYTVRQGDRHVSLTLLPGGVRRVDLRPECVLDFKVTSVAGGPGELTLRVSAEGAGLHTFTMRVDNLNVEHAEQTLELQPGRPQVAVWRAKVVAGDTPWVAVVVPDGVLANRREISGMNK